MLVDNYIHLHRLEPLMRIYYRIFQLYTVSTRRFVLNKLKRI